MKVVFHFRAGPRIRERLMNAAPTGTEIAIVDENDDAGLAEAMRDAEVLLHVLRPVTTKIINAAPKLRLIQKIGVGVNTIDLKAARARGVAVANMPGTNSQAVAEHTLALMFAVLRKVPYLDRVTRAGRGWEVPREDLETGGEICGRTVGLIGYGEVPRRMAPVLSALGAEVVYSTRTVRSGAIGKRLSFEDVLRRSDILSLHVPLTDETRLLIDADAFSKMKAGAVLINTARGELVDEDTLSKCLRAGQLRGAGVDVFSDEPAPVDHPLFGLNNVVLTPHIAWLTPETIERSLHVAFENLARLRDGKGLLHRIEQS